MKWEHSKDFGPKSGSLSSRHAGRRAVTNRERMHLEKRAAISQTFQSTLARECMLSWHLREEKVEVQRFVNSQILICSRLETRIGDLYSFLPKKMPM